MLSKNISITKENREHRWRSLREEKEKEKLNLYS